MNNLTTLGEITDLNVPPTFWWGVLILFVGFLFLSFLVLLVRRYKRCPSNRVLVIYGKVGGGNTSRCIHGGAAFVMPLLQEFSWLSLDPIQIEANLKGALSIENIRVNVPSVFTVAVGTEPELMTNAAIRLLGLSGNEIKGQAEHIIFGQLRQVIASMSIDQINRHREQFLTNIQHSLEPELRKIGLVLINVNITDITDESGYISAIGKKAASQAIQQALIDVAQQEKLGAIGMAAAEREKAIEVANAQQLRDIGIRDAQRSQAVKIADLNKEQQIGEQTAARDQAVKLAELDRDRKIAEQSAVFARDTQVKNAEQAMRINIANADASAIAGEAAAQAKVAQAKATLQVAQAESYQIGETKKRESEAAVQEAQNRAMAKAAIADAEKVEAERRAAVEAPAKAEKAKTIVEAEAAAEKRRIEATGEASAIFAKLEAEARGQYEILAKKGEGLKAIVQACGGSQQAFQLLMLEHLDKLAEASSRAISNIKFDKIVVWEGGGNGDGKEKGTSGTSNFLQSMARTLPPMMQVMKDIGGVELPESLIKMTGEAAVAGTASGNAAPAAPGKADSPTG
jgi:flotillin